MRQILIALALIAAAGAASFLAVARFRPDVLPPRVRPFGPREVAEKPPAKEDEAGLEENAPDDGWCEHRKMAGSAGCKRSMPTVRLASKDTAEEVGLKAVQAETRTVAPTVSGNAEISFVSHDYAHITSRVSGRVADVPTDEGRFVKKGDVLVVVDSAEVGSAKAQYLSILPVVDLARREFERTAQLRASNATSEKDELAAHTALAKAEAELLNARQRLLNMGLTLAEIDRIARTKDTSNLLNILAPMAGRLVERHAVIGEAVTPPNGAVTTGLMQSLFDIADTAEMWAWIDIGEGDLPKVAIGQEVRFTISGTEEPVFSGHVELISFAVNTATRTVRVRAGLKNIDERLRANQYGRAVIRVGPERSAVVVPRDAVQSDAGVEFVFLPLLDGRRFRTQRVETRPTERHGEVEVAFGLRPGDRVVTEGSFLLKSELFKASLAGE
jgi:cobalt-zinc-cadmium efflux system membrane fusion protein